MFADSIGRGVYLLCSPLAQLIIHFQTCIRPTEGVGSQAAQPCGCFFLGSFGCQSFASLPPLPSVGLLCSCPLHFLVLILGWKRLEGTVCLLMTYTQGSVYKYIIPPMRKQVGNECEGVWKVESLYFLSHYHILGFSRKKKKSWPEYTEPQALPISAAHYLCDFGQVISLTSRPHFIYVWWGM